nr:hypothetical protein [Tanacetum cinerariifolium]
MGEPLSPDRVFDFPMDKPKPHPAYDFFVPEPLPGYASNPNKNRGIVVDVPLLGELGAEEEIDKEHEESYKNIDWNAAFDHVQSKEPQLQDRFLPIFQAKFDANMKFLFKSREEIEKEDEEIIKSINETPAQKAAKIRKLSEEA